MKNPSERSIPLEGGGRTTALVYRGHRPAAGLILAHGAGGGQHSAFMVEFAEAFAALQVDVVTFNFPYIEQGRHIPDRAPVLEGTYRAIIEHVREHVDSARNHLFIGGKSMGGRIATQIAAGDPDVPVEGLVLFGYPLHPPGKPDQRRDKHLTAIKQPLLILQGSRDAFGTPPEFESLVRTMAGRMRLHVVERGDHSFKLPSRNPGAQAALHGAIHKTVVDWIREIMDGHSRQST